MAIVDTDTRNHATQDVSERSDLGVVYSLAASKWAFGVLDREGDENSDPSLADRALKHTGQTIRILRNSKNNVYHRALAARALGLLMVYDRSLLSQLRLELEELVESLLQLIHYCRRHNTQNIDTRRVHVNCCLVISMLMQTSMHSQSQQNLQLIVSLDSDLLVMPSQPVEHSSAFLLLTVSGCREVVEEEQRCMEDSMDNKTRHQRPPLRSFSKSSTTPPMIQHNSTVPPQALKIGTNFSHSISENSEFRFPKLTDNSVTRAQSSMTTNLVTMAQNVERLKTPNREFKMDRFRVVTPAFIRPSKPSSPLRIMPLIPPTLVYAPNNQQEEMLDLTPTRTTSPCVGGSLLPSQHMVEIFRTGKMPVVSAEYFHMHLRDNLPSQPIVPSRLQAVEWSEWKRLERSGGNMDIDAPQTNVNPASLLPPPFSNMVKCRPTFPVHRKGATLSLHTREYKQERLHRIISSPIEPNAINTRQLQKFARNVHATTLNTLDAEMNLVRSQESRMRDKMGTFVDEQRDKLPLKFLFQLSGGVAYCRSRMHRAMGLWIQEFENNQVRMALLQWKAFIEQCRFRQRGTAYHQVVVEKRLHIAIDYIRRAYQKQALTKWIESVQIAIWDDRDTSVRVIQRQVRRRIALHNFLVRHDRYPIGWESKGVSFRDVYLGPYRNLRFEIPQRVREERRKIWDAVKLVQGVYRRRRFWQFLSRHRSAAIKIQAVARMRIARAAYRLFRKRIILFQAQVRMQHCYRAYQTMYQAILLVQVNYRSVRIRRFRRLVLTMVRRDHEWFITRVLLLQRIVRGFLGRRDARRRRRDQEEEFQAALVVQRCWYRRNNEWSTFLLLGCLREKENEENAFDRQVEHFRRRHMSYMIQSTYRAYRSNKQRSAALCIQCAFRRWRAIRCVQHKRMERIAHRRIKFFFRIRHRHRHMMARKIQFWWLNAIPFRLLVHFRQQHLAYDSFYMKKLFETEQYAATVLQSLVRGQRGRLFARREHSARILQSAIRSFLRWRRVEQEIRRIKHMLAVEVATKCVTQGTDSVFEKRLTRLHQAAKEIQRFVRGDRWRHILTRYLVKEEIHHRMALRIQLFWRQNAQHRMAKRLLKAQRRRLMNPFRSLSSLSSVLVESRTRAREFYDPDDDVAGLHFAAWLRRLGLDEKYLDLVKKSRLFIDNGLAQLRTCPDANTVRERLRNIGIDNNHDLNIMVTNLLATQTLRKCRILRAQVHLAKKMQRDDDKRLDMLKQHQRRAEHRRDEIQAKVDEVLIESRDFRNPPKALRDKQESLTKELIDAQKILTAARVKHDMFESLVLRRREILHLDERELSNYEKEEDSAHYSQQDFRLIRDLSVVRDIFLQYFPSLEARAIAFMNTLDIDSITKAQLMQFFTRYKTIAEVKRNMPVLTQFTLVNEVKKYDTVRFNACSDILQYACERMCEIMNIAIEDIVYLTNGRFPVERATSNINKSMLQAELLNIVYRAHACTKPRQRTELWTEGTIKLNRMNNAALRFQVLWRRRVARKSMLALRRSKVNKAIKAEYLEEIHTDNVTPLWKAEREREMVVYEQQKAAERVAAHLKALDAVLRWPFREHWDAITRSTVFGYTSKDGTWHYVNKRPTYTTHEDNAVIIIQALIRQYLARMKLVELQRLQRRNLQRLRVEKMWCAKADERRQTFTIRWRMKIVSRPQVSLWIDQRKSRISRQIILNEKIQSKTILKSTSDMREDYKLSARVTEFHHDLRSQVVECEKLYHQSVRNDHRRNSFFSITARPLNAHTQSILNFLEKYQTVQNKWSASTETTTRLEYTLVGLRYGWRVAFENDCMCYYNSITNTTSWDRPEYDFDDEYAAIKIQSIVRMLIAQNLRAQMLNEMSLVTLVRATVASCEKIGWIGYGLEGVSTAVFLTRLGLTKYISELEKLSIDNVLARSDLKLKKLGFTKEELSVLKMSAPSCIHRKSPRSSCTLTLHPSIKHHFNFLPTERVVQQLIAQSLPNQQGRVITLVRALKNSSTPVTYRQLEMHLRIYAGRPDDALANIGEIASLAHVTQEVHEHAIVMEYIRCAERCIVLAVSLRLRALHEELTLRLRIARRLISGHDNGESLSLPMATTSVSDIDRGVLDASRRYPEKIVKGMWERIPSEDVWSCAQVALYLRECVLEYVLIWVRSVILVQSLYRMHKVYRWYQDVVSFRNLAVTTIQCAWRKYCAMEHRRYLESQQSSEYEQCIDKKTKKFYYVYKPTREKLMEEPRDHQGQMLSFRPMVEDRITKRWILAWPQLEQLGKNQEKANFNVIDEEGAFPCSICNVERAVRRCNECYSLSGDYIDHCLVCFYDRHASENVDTNWHTFTPLHLRKTTVFCCIECQRFSTLRCIMCHEHYCERCFRRVHGKGHRRMNHKCEYYESQAIVCIDCEARVALHQCLACQDALCEDCMMRTHRKGKKVSHELKLIRQHIDETVFSYCQQCHARRGDTRCEFCALTLCQPCILGRDKHAVICLESELQQKKQELLGERICVECSKPADRLCETCNDHYCSVRWMGNPGCFERFHYRGKRADHAFKPYEAPQMTPEIRELEERVKQKRRDDAEAAEAEAKRMAAVLLCVQQEQKEVVARKKDQKSHAKQQQHSKRTILGAARVGYCSVNNCKRQSIAANILYCTQHFTSQHALEVTKEDPIEAAKMLSLIDKNGGKLVSVEHGKAYNAISSGLNFISAKFRRKSNDTLI